MIIEFVVCCDKSQNVVDDENRYRQYIDGMEELGIVAGPNGQKPRDVLISKDEWFEKLSRVSLD